MSPKQIPDYQSIGCRIEGSYSESCGRNPHCWARLSRVGFNGSMQGCAYASHWKTPPSWIMVAWSPVVGWHCQRYWVNREWISSSLAYQNSFWSRSPSLGRVASEIGSMVYSSLQRYPDYLTDSPGRLMSQSISISPRTENGRSTLSFDFVCSRLLESTCKRRSYKVDLNTTTA